MFVSFAAPHRRNLFVPAVRCILIVLFLLYTPYSTCTLSHTIKKAENQEDFEESRVERLELLVVSLDEVVVVGSGEGEDVEDNCEARLLFRLRGAAHRGADRGAAVVSRT